MDIRSAWVKRLASEFEEINRNGNGEEAEPDNERVGFADKGNQRRGFFRAKAESLEDRLHTVREVGAE